MMKKVFSLFNLILMIVILVACWGEFILCFARGYEEFWATILIPSVIITALCIAGYKTRLKWLYAIGSVIIIVGAVLLIGFPSYIMYLGLILGAISLVAEIVWLVLHLRNRKKA
ncbi:MAG: hypothetical protein LUE27_06015 [Clostridia bacterium]|nr:hypothetical protein [Clostridia bacterium]